LTPRRLKGEPLGGEKGGKGRRKRRDREVEVDRGTHSGLAVSYVDPELCSQISSIALFV